MSLFSYALVVFLQCSPPLIVPPQSDTIPPLALDELVGIAGFADPQRPFYQDTLQVEILSQNPASYYNPYNYYNYFPSDYGYYNPYMYGNPSFYGRNTTTKEDVQLSIDAFSLSFFFLKDARDDGKVVKENIRSFEIALENIKKVYISFSQAEFKIEQENQSGNLTFYFAKDDSAKKIYKTLAHLERKFKFELSVNKKLKNDITQ